MYRVLTNITFTQHPTANDPTRTGTIVYNFCNEFEVVTTWDTLTDDGTITLPRNVYITDKSGRRFSLAGSNNNLGGFGTNSPVFLRGDKVVIKWAYAYLDKLGNEVAPTWRTIFSGFVSSVTSKKPFVLGIEDAMYKLKQTPAVGAGGRRFFPSKTYTVEKMVREMLQEAGLSYTVNDLTATKAGDIHLHNETIAEVLAQLRKDYNFKSYFKGDELRIGSKVYIDSDAAASGQKIFEFQKTIIDDNLEYQRKDDLVVSTVATNTVEELTGATTKDGHAKTKRKKLEVLITLKEGSDTPTYTVGTKENPIPPNMGGQRFTDTFSNAMSLEELKTAGLNNLRLRYYTGFKGKFTTFGAPYVSMGDNVDLLDGILPERNGRYKVKAVTYRGGTGGLRQEIELDYLIARLDSAGKVIQK